MPLIPYEPFRPLEDTGRFLERFFSTPWFSDGPRIDIFETDEEIVAHCEIPGLERKEDISIDIRDNILDIRGSIKRGREIKEENMHRRERFTGSFHRAVTLPGPVVAEGAKASYRNGVLEVTMPKAEPGARRRQIEIDFH